MCLFAKDHNHELLAFYLSGPEGGGRSSGRLELRDENFQTVPVESITNDCGMVLVMDEEDTNPGWNQVSPSFLKQLARERMHESLTGLRELYRTA